MKVTFDKQKLLGAIVPAASISTTKNTLATVEGLLFECPPNPKFGEYDGEDPNVCRISAFDLEKGLRTTVECSIYEEGLYVLNTSKILQIVRALPDGDVTLDIDERGHVTISGGYSQFEITASPGEEFPTMPKFVGENRVKISQSKLRALISETVFAVAQNDQRAAFNGALFRLESGRLTVVGCDGNRLSAARAILEGVDPDVKAEMIIPGKFLTDLLRLLRDTEDEVTVIIGRKNIIFEIDGIYIFTRMLDSEYMAYERLFPKGYMTQAFVSRGELLAALERASIVTEDKLGSSGRTYVKFEFGGNKVSVSSVSSGGSIHEEVPAAIDGNPLTIGFNCKFFLDALKACPVTCDRLRIRLNAPLMGVIIEPAEGTDFLDQRPDPSVYGERALDVDAPKEIDPDADLFLYFVMPMRMNGNV